MKINRIWIVSSVLIALSAPSDSADTIEYKCEIEFTEQPKGMDSPREFVMSENQSSCPKGVSAFVVSNGRLVVFGRGTKGTITISSLDVTRDKAEKYSALVRGQLWKGNAGLVTCVLRTMPVSGSGTLSLRNEMVSCQDYDSDSVKTADRLTLDIRGSFKRK